MLGSRQRTSNLPPTDRKRRLVTWRRPCRRRPTMSPPASATRGTCATTRWRPSPSWRCGCSGRCCSRASRAPARPRWPRRSPTSLDLPLVRLQCYEGIDATQALYDWDFPRQILHLRALEAAGSGADVEEAEKSLYDERFLLARPVLAALQQSPAVLLVDEVDRADDEFEAFLLEVLSTYQVEHPRARHRRRRDAAGRGADLQPHPRAARRPQAALPLPLDRAPRPRAGGADRPRPARPRSRRSWPGRSSGSCSSCGDVGLQKPPGVAETLDWARALHHLGTATLDLESSARTLGALVKYREDSQQVQQALDQMLRA